MIRIDDIKSMVSTFKQAGMSSLEAEADSTYTSDQSFLYSAPTMLHHSGKKQTPKPKKENSAEFWLDKGLLYATYDTATELGNLDVKKYLLKNQ
jgi:hypothetical protein